MSKLYGIYDSDTWGDERVWTILGTNCIISQFFDRSILKHIIETLTRSNDKVYLTDIISDWQVK
jgi:hypothetical protein